MAGSESTVRLLDLINAADSLPLDFDFNTLYKLLLPNDDRPHGFLSAENVSILPWTPSFEIDHSARTVRLLPSPNPAPPDDPTDSTYATQAFLSVTRALLKVSPYPQISHPSEFCPILGQPLIHVERFPTPLFGVAGRGAHINIFVRLPNNELRIWIAKRSVHNATYPGMYDSPVAGGVKAVDTPLECAVAEADEEASLPASLVRENIVSAGVVTYIAQKPSLGNSVQPDVLYVYDLLLPADIVLKPQDGEVEEFVLWDVETVLRVMKEGKFKPNVCLVMIDFFVRFGVVTQDNEQDYIEIAQRLRRRLPVPVTPTGVGSF